MPGYKEKGLTQFQHKYPTKRQNSPHPHTPPKYGAKIQYAKAADTSAPLDTKGQKFIQRVNGKYLYLGHAVEGTLLVPLSSLASQQTKPTEETMNSAKQFLDYVASQEDAILTFNASETVLAGHSDVSYLSKPNVCSRAGGHLFLSNHA